jgi:hypothetical protein
MTPREAFLTATALVLSHANLCIAQAGAPKDFYENNYAKSTGDISTRGAQAVVGAKESKQRSKRSSGAVTVEKRGGEADQGKVLSKTKKRRVIVSVVVNSLDKAHFEKVVEEVFRLRDTNSAFISELLHIGDYTVVTDKLEDECAKRGILIHQIDSPPKDLAVNTSPAWRVQTRDGFYVVEGFLSLGGFINEWGEFDPEGHEGGGSDLKVEGF